MLYFSGLRVQTPTKEISEIVVSFQFLTLRKEHTLGLLYEKSVIFPFPYELKDELFFKVRKI